MKKKNKREQPKINQRRLILMWVFGLGSALKLMYEIDPWLLVIPLFATIFVLMIWEATDWYCVESTINDN